MLRETDSSVGPHPTCPQQREDADSVWSQEPGCLGSPCCPGCVLEEDMVGSRAAVEPSQPGLGPGSLPARPGADPSADYIFKAS